ncbi:MAG: protein translocase subunit SecD [Armatimonadetes bacterium]|nr:protein translocase subunit SecD [Armatimonadota bacterium]
MSKYHKLLLLTIALIIAAATIVWNVPMRRGLDLAGGIRVVLQAEEGSLVGADGKPLNTADKAKKMDAVIKVIRSRVKGLAGVAEPVVQRQGDDRVIVELPGLKDKKRALEDIQSTAQLEFYWLRDVESERNVSGKWEMLDPEVDAETGIDVYSFRNKATQEIIKGDTAVGQRRIVSEVINAYDPIKNPDGIKPMLTGDDLKPNAKGDLSNGTVPVISIEFNPKGTKIFRDFTRRHVGDITAILLGGKIITAPTVRVPITDGKAIIERFETLDDAQRRAEFLNAGALPVPLQIAQMDDIEATLGTETVNQALMAGILGLGLVLLFMLAYYRLPGLLANVALVIYALLTFGAYKAAGATMTLPGLAGFILSIGMAVDANILIFERLKEELKSGKTLRASIDTGFARAFTAIFDSNVCTAITCIILMWYGSGPVQSFAFTLLVGVAISMFSAITVTRTFLHLLVSQEWAQKPSLFGLGTSWFARTGRQLDIIGKRNYYFALSGLVILLGLIAYGVNWSATGSGLRPGIEFKPGTSIQMTFDRPVTLTEVTRIVSAEGVENTVQISGGKTAFVRTSLIPGETTKESLAWQDKVDGIQKALEKNIGPIKDVQTSTVGPVVSAELTKNAIIAVVLASIAIVIYLSFRFAIGGVANGVKYGTAAIVALIHDVLVTVGLFAALGYLLKWEVDTLFVTALLTIIGFSVHDSIVVFDRMRENLRHRLRGEDYEGLANRSILQTFARSINTTLTVVLTLAALTAFGGPIIRHFYIALLVGIISGTYSSIFNATPVLVVWEGIAARRKSGGRRTFEDKPLVAEERARNLRPVEEDKTAGNGSGVESEGQVAAARSPGRVKTKPKKKRRY